MDFMPTPFYVPYLKHTRKGDYYSLTLDDFMAALTKIQKTMKVVVKNHADPRIHRFDDKSQFEWLRSNVSPEAEEVRVDEWFLEKEWGVEGMERVGDVSVLI